MAGPGVIYADNETESQISRLTKEGKRFTYKLAVLQQPSRARACGSGAKSSADRRPVDPPPIVELRVLEGEDGHLKDVTMAVDSVFVLFAALEPARHVAHGKMSQDQSNHCVLTGTPAAGTAFLERPAVAGYFVFPDLSVRHEGQYRLSFSLFEEVRDPRNEDPCDDPSSSLPSAFYTHRLEVKSKPFTVYSAKKFPGLTESTALSRMVAEQGCRVRIRRDVRLRKRDAKGGKDWNAYEDATAEVRARMSKTPEGSVYSRAPPEHGNVSQTERPRFDSRTTSHQSLVPPISRRSSVQEMAQDYHQRTYGTTPYTPQNSYPQSSPYGSGPPPGQMYLQPPSMHRHSTTSIPPPQYQQSPNYPGHPQSLPLAQSHQEYYGSTQPGPPAVGRSPYEQPQHTHNNAPSPRHHRLNDDHRARMAHESRRASTQYDGRSSLSEQAQYRSHHFSQSTYQPPPSVRSAHQDDYNRRASCGAVNGHAPTRPRPTEPQLHTLKGRNEYIDKLPPLTTTLAPRTDSVIEPVSPVSVTPPDTHKRQFGQVFNERHLKQPLRQGARPTDSSAYGSLDLQGSMHPQLDDEEPDTYLGLDDVSLTMAYRRADGRKVLRDLPAKS